MSRAHKQMTARARAMLGASAIAYTERSTRFDSGRMRGRCIACLRTDCQAPKTMTVALRSDIALHIRARGHSWAEVFDKLNNTHSAAPRKANP